MEFLSEYGLFLAKAVTIVIAILMIVSVVAATAQSRQRRDHKGDIIVTPLNDFYEELRDALQHSVLDKDQLKQIEKDRKKEEKSKKKHKEEPRKKRVFVLDFDGDVKASGVEQFANEITAVLTMAEKQDEVVLRLESPGGQVHSYGLASSQLERFRQKEIPLTVCVDKVAASGGYMMACTANKILAAPFAILGSIGVVAELPNFNRILRKYDVDYDIYTAGEFKRTVTMLGENTDEGKKKFVEEIEETHVLFKDLIKRNRPSLDVDAVATGEHWYGQQCLEKGLIDGIQTSEDYLYEISRECEIFEVSFEVKRSMADRLGFAMEGALTRAVSRVLGTSQLRGKNLI
ncbi:protease SohB [Ketobacter sp.]|uniref:protease SohB n=1 Tax=Ketobacter sp. TaxID=2083498 RepID=UPI000F1E696D|nr:protease SohB [Ketobacter sp.]RLT98747.1 MAG: protease SohB [Ketobacter sp.]